MCDTFYIKPNKCSCRLYVSIVTLFLLFLIASFTIFFLISNPRQNYLFADSRQAIEAVTGRFEAHDTFSWTTESDIANADRRAPSWERRIVAGAAGRGGAPRGGESGAAGRRHYQRHVGRPALLHAADAPTLSPKPSQLWRLQLLVLVSRHRLEQSYRRVLHRCVLFFRTPD